MNEKITSYLPAGYKTCPVCEGTGTDYSSERMPICTFCDGEGYVTESMAKDEE